MNDKIKEILDKLQLINNCEFNFTYTIIQKSEAKALLDYITNLQERKITKEDVDKYFEENMCVSFNKFIENCDEQEKLANYYKKENERLKEELKNRPIVDFTFDTYKELENYKSRCEKTVNEIQQLIDDINNETIIGLNNFLPKLEEIQDKLANGGDEE